ncbi:MAG: hypothetical protein Q4Q22_09330 [Methanosphaera sp.]|nr:hypothetical protein [Methanosphaera sp.]
MHGITSDRGILRQKWATVQEDFFVNMKQVDPDVTVLATVKDSLEDYDTELMQEHLKVFFEGLDFASLEGMGADVPVAWPYHNDITWQDYAKLT